MAERHYLGGTEGTSTLLAAARSFLSACHFQAAEDCLRTARDIELSPQLLMLSGQCALYQGQLNAAAEWYLQGWEMAKRSGDSHSIAGCCVRLSLIYHRTRDAIRAWQFFQFAMKETLFTLEADAGRYFPVELRLLQVMINIDQVRVEDLRSEINQLRSEVHEPELSGWLAEALADSLPETFLEATLDRGTRDYQISGDLFSALRVLERLAQFELSQGNWEHGKERLRQASQMANRLDLPSKSAEYQNWIRRLNLSLHLVSGTADWN